MICIKWRKTRQCLALAGVLLALTCALILAEWDSLLMWRIHKRIAGYSQDDNHSQVQRLKSVDLLARHLRSDRKRNTVLMLNAARTFLAENEGGKTNEAYIVFIHLKSLVIRDLQYDGIPASTIVGNIRPFVETNAYAYAIQLRDGDARQLVWQSRKETAKRMEEARKTDELLRKLKNMAMVDRIQTTGSSLSGREGVVNAPSERVGESGVVPDDGK
jgi:hypothetical protein